MTDWDQRAPSLDDFIKVAAHHRSAMVERRNIGLKITVGAVAFDLLVLKLIFDAIPRVRDLGVLSWVARIISVGTLLVLTGMLVQIEIRSRFDRMKARTAERRVQALLDGKPPMDIPAMDESLFVTIRQAWAATWPLAGVAILTAAMWLLTSVLTGPAPGGP